MVLDIPAKYTTLSKSISTLVILLTSLFAFTSCSGEPFKCNGEVDQVIKMVGEELSSVKDKCGEYQNINKYREKEVIKYKLGGEKKYDDLNMTILSISGKVKLISISYIYLNLKDKKGRPYIDRYEEIYENISKRNVILSRNKDKIDIEGTYKKIKGWSLKKEEREGVGGNIQVVSGVVQKVYAKNEDGVGPNKVDGMTATTEFFVVDSAFKSVFSD